MSEEYLANVNEWLDAKPCDFTKCSENKCWALLKCPEYEAWYKLKPAPRATERRTR